jgi:hypothetical protein
MKWTWFDEVCLRVYARVVSTIWHWEYLAEEHKKKLED